MKIGADGATLSFEQKGHYRHMESKYHCRHKISGKEEDPQSLDVFRNSTALKQTPSMVQEMLMGHSLLSSQQKRHWRNSRPFAFPFLRPL